MSRKIPATEEELYKWLPAGLWPDPDSDEEFDMFYDAFVNPELTREQRLKAQYEWLEYLIATCAIERGWWDMEDFERWSSGQ